MLNFEIKISFFSFLKSFLVIESSKATNAVFKTIPSAIALIHTVAIPCQNHKPKMSTDSVSTAWQKAREVVEMFWTLRLAEKDDNNPHYCTWLWVI